MIHYTIIEKKHDGQTTSSQIYPEFPQNKKNTKFMNTQVMLYRLQPKIEKYVSIL